MSFLWSRRKSLFFPIVLALAAAACSSAPQPKVVNPKAGPLPEGGDWAGVYYDQVWGYLHLLADGDSVNGAWRTTSGDAYGELHGEIDGNLLKFAWQERKIGAVGADASRKGSGYFVYSIPKEGEAHEIIGEWGLGDENAGNAWRAVKQKNMVPNPQSVKPDEIEGRVTGVDGWDDGGGSSEGESNPE